MRGRHCRGYLIERSHLHVRCWLLAHRDLASRIHVRNAPKADKLEPTRMTDAVEKRLEEPSEQ